MEYKILATVFIAVFIAELGDKTQLATMLFAANKDVSKITVFVGASLALIVASGIGVLAGSLISQYIKRKISTLYCWNWLYGYRRVLKHEINTNKANALSSVTECCNPSQILRCYSIGYFVTNLAIISVVFSIK